MTNEQHVGAGKPCVRCRKEDAARKGGNDDTTDLLNFLPENGGMLVTVTTCGYMYERIFFFNVVTALKTILCIH